MGLFSKGKSSPIKSISSSAKSISSSAKSISSSAGKSISSTAGKAVSATAGGAAGANLAEMEKLKKQLKESKEKIVKLKKEIEDLKYKNENQREKITLLEQQLQYETELYNTTYKLYTDALEDTIIALQQKKLAEFNLSVSETQTLIEDLNQPYVNRGDDIVSMLSKYIPISNADATYQTIQYRNGDFDNLKKTNNTINIVYYVGVIFLFVLLFTSNNVFLSNRFIFYIFLILLPFLYPWIYLYTIKIWKYFFPVKYYSGPKNAFIDEATNQSNVYYN